MLSCYTWVTVVLMNDNDESCYTFMLYLWMFNTRPYVYSEHGEPPRTKVQPQGLYGSGLGRVIREVFVWLLLA
jgi:hypothetical protein